MKKLTQANARLEVLRIFEVYAARGAATNTGARNAADKAWLKLKSYLLVENQLRLVDARAKAHAGDRTLFDATIARLRPEFEKYARTGERGPKAEEP